MTKLTVTVIPPRLTQIKGTGCLYGYKTRGEGFGVDREKDSPIDHSPKLDPTF